MKITNWDNNSQDIKKNLLELEMNLLLLKNKKISDLKQEWKNSTIDIEMLMRENLDLSENLWTELM